MLQSGHKEARYMTKLELAANIAVVLTCVVTLVRTVADKTPKAPPQSYKSGEKIADSPSLDFRDAKRTLVLFESSTCHFCNESLGFYSRLASLAHKNGTRIVALTFEDTGVNKSFLATHGVEPDAVLALKDTKLKVFATPTLILVKNDGTVVASWVGKLPAQKESEVIAKLL
jgi:thioredoxin-related protein